MKTRRFPSGAVRSDDTGRIRPDYLSPYALKYIAECFSNNSNDFGATNYFKGIKPCDIFPSISRHYLDLHELIIEGKHNEVKREIASLAQNCIMALHQIIMEEKGLYKEVHDKTELIDKEEALNQDTEAIIRNTPSWTITNGTSSTVFMCSFWPSGIDENSCNVGGKPKYDHIVFSHTYTK
jgi:hypothetical protein